MEGRNPTQSASQGPAPRRPQTATKGRRKVMVRPGPVKVVLRERSPQVPTQEGGDRDRGNEEDDE